MIRYSLKCAADHGFDSWFQSGSAFDSLLAAGHEAEVARMFGGLSEADLDALTDILKRMGTA